ncbi:MAG: hypothetical protein ACRCUP_01210 [Mycoplasmatales bacterium]
MLEQIYNNPVVTVICLGVLIYLIIRFVKKMIFKLIFIALSFLPLIKQIIEQLN